MSSRRKLRDTLTHINLALYPQKNPLQAILPIVIPKLTVQPITAANASVLARIVSADKAAAREHISDILRRLFEDIEVCWICRCTQTSIVSICRYYVEIAM